MNISFRLVGESEVGDAYAIYLGVFEWLKAKGVRQWLRALPHDVFLERQRRGELFACHVDQEFAAVVSLAFEASTYWFEELGDDRRWWIKTLVVRK